MDLNTILIRMALEVPFVVALIYLVLKLEDRRQDAMRLREESNQKIVDSLLGLIDEISARSNPDSLTSKQTKLIREYLNHESKH